MHYNKVSEKHFSVTNEKIISNYFNKKSNTIHCYIKNILHKVLKLFFKIKKNVLNKKLNLFIYPKIRKG
jgi:hypothetical protein